MPPPQTASWRAIRWRRLAPDDPLRLLRSVLSWRGGYIAVDARASEGSSATPVWTSRDGGLWMPVPFDTATTFWPGLLVVGIGEVPSGLIALTLLDGSSQRGAGCPAYGPTLPLMSWTSPDGRSWTPHAGPDLGQPSTWSEPPILAAGSAGLVAASPTSPTRLATSVDGIHWRTLPAGALPSGLRIRDVVGTTVGFTAVGALPVDADHERAVAMRSADGATWTGPFALEMGTARDPQGGAGLGSVGPGKATGWPPAHRCPIGSPVPPAGLVGGTAYAQAPYSRPSHRGERPSHQAVGTRLPRGAGMPKLVVTHAVIDVERWLKGKAERVAVIGPYATNVTDHVAMDGSNNVAITADIHDMAGAQAMMTSPSPEDAALEEKHGVIQPMTVYIEK